MKEQSIQELIDLYGNDPLKLLSAVDGFYEVKKDTNGKRLSPLVGYAGKYDVGDSTQLQWVGEIYANFAKAEEHPQIMYHLTKLLWIWIGEEFISNLKTPIVFVGPAMGGISVAQFMAFHASKKHNARYACAEKVITKIKTDTMREQSELQFARHSVNPGETVIICEDVLNNFSTTEKIVELVQNHKAKVGAIIGLLNRSMVIKSTYTSGNNHIPVIPLVHKPYAEYKQNDPYVIEDIRAGNIVLKPKNQWNKLKMVV